MSKQGNSKNRMYLLLGIVIGALFGFIGSFVSGYYFWGREHTEDQWMFWFCLVVFTGLVVWSAYMIHKLDKKA